MPKDDSKNDLSAVCMHDKDVRMYCWVFSSLWLLSFFYADILLNVFLAIAVDNLADADSLTAIEKEEGEVAAEVIRFPICEFRDQNNVGVLLLWCGALFLNEIMTM